MSDQWDPKYPRTGGLWEDGYLQALEYIHDPTSAWSNAFAAVVRADEDDNEFERVRWFYNFLGMPEDVTRLGDCRLALWDLYCIPMFQRERAEWPSYAEAVYTAALLSPMRSATDGIPQEWIDNKDESRVRAFKTTVLFIAGLIEGDLPPRPESKEMLIARLIEQKVKQRLSTVMRSLMQARHGIDLPPTSAGKRW